MRARVLTGILLSCIMLPFSWAQAATDAPYADTLTGDWNGARSKLANAGIEVGLNYAGDVWAVTGGGLKRTTTYLDLLELRVDLDGEKLYGIKGNTVSVAVINSNGAHPNASSVGSVQGISNSEVAENGLRLYEAWMNQEFLDGRLAVLLGVHDLNSEFATTAISDNFLKPTMQIGQSFAQSGRAGPAIFPTPALAARVRALPTEHSYVAAAIYDGVPGDADHPRSNPINLGDKDGALYVGEVGYVTDPETQWNKLALGVWSYTAKLDDQLNASVKQQPQGAYALVSHTLYENQKRGYAIGGFWRGGIADGDTAQVDWDYTAGLVGTGLVPVRPSAEIGLGMSHAHNSDTYMQAQAAAVTPADRNEYSYELYYRDTLCPGVAIQPDLQYVVNPGTDAVTHNATVLGLRVDVNF